MVGGFPSPWQRKSDFFLRTYYLGWKDHPNLGYGIRSPNFQNFLSRPTGPLQHPTSKLGISSEDIVKTLGNNSQ